MNSRTSKLALVVPVMLGLSACSAAGGADETSSVSEGTSSVIDGTIELAVSETCTEVSEPQCISVDDANVVLPSAFKRAGVEDATVAEGEGQNAVDVTFSEDEAEVFNALTEKAAGAGETARLVMKIGGEIQTAVAVMQPLEGDHLQISLSPDDSAQEIVDLIHG